MSKHILDVPQFLIGYGAEYVGCSRMTLKDYEEKGFFEKPVVRDAVGRRRYSQRQLDQISAVFRARNPR